MSISTVILVVTVSAVVSLLTNWIIDKIMGR